MMVQTKVCLDTQCTHASRIVTSNIILFVGLVHQMPENSNSPEHPMGKSPSHAPAMNKDWIVTLRICWLISYHITAMRIWRWTRWSWFCQTSIVNSTWLFERLAAVLGPDSRLGLFTVPYTVTAVIVRLQYGYGPYIYGRILRLEDLLTVRCGTYTAVYGNTADRQ